MIVADSNLIAYLLVPGSMTPKAEAVALRDPDWIAPPIWRSELRSMLALQVWKTLLALPQAIAIMEKATSLIADSPEPQSRRVLELAASSRCSAYDCEFLTVAENENTVVVTADAKMLRAFPKKTISIDDFAAGM